MKRLLFIYNPHAGQGKVGKSLPEIIQVFSYQGYLPSVHPTRGVGDATSVVRGIGRHYSRIVCCGGDGTLHEVTAALLGMDKPPVLGYIPAGTTNDFSRNLNLPRDMVLAAKVAVGDHTLRCDMGRFNDAHFAYVAAFGAFTDVSYDTPQHFKNLFGHLAYVLEGIGRLGTIRGREMSIEYDGGTLEGSFIFGMVSNARSVGGFQGWPAQEVDLGDGRFEVVLVRQPKNPLELQAILHSAFTKSPTQDGPLIGFHTSRLRLHCEEEVAWTLDGEFGGRHRDVSVENLHQALELCCRE